MNQRAVTLTFHHLAFERDFRILFQHVSGILHAGELLQVHGTNGSGKSTLLRILACYLEPHDGHIFWQNKSIYEQRENYQQALHYLGHQNGIKANLTVQENLRLIYALYNMKVDALMIQHTLKQVGLHLLTDTLAMNLSAGQTRRLALARLLLFPKSLWILDEPTTALDTNGQHLFADLLDQHLAQGGGIAVVATHQNLLLKNDSQKIELHVAKIKHEEPTYA